MPALGKVQKAENIFSTFVPISNPIPNKVMEAPRSVALGPESESKSMKSLIERPLELMPSVCAGKLVEGCYLITFEPNSGINIFRGTMRVEKHSSGSNTLSGDLYKYLNFLSGMEVVYIPINLSKLQPWGSNPFVFSVPQDIPIRPRDKYYSYLKVIDLRFYPVFGGNFTLSCGLALTMEEYVYDQPATGFNGTFDSAPSRTIAAYLTESSPPAGYKGIYFDGKVYEESTEIGSFSMGWVSSYFRRAKLEIDTLVGAEPPLAVPGTSFSTIFETAGWDLTVVYDDAKVPVPAGVTPDVCWTNGDLHDLMLSSRDPVDLDGEWLAHLMVVPAAMDCDDACFRGVMYDRIETHREGTATFSDDGYPSCESINFGTAEGKLQREVPRAYLRSAAHEVGHLFNQDHPSSEGYPDDNSIMTQTNRVADVLATTGSEIFPDDIQLSFNDHNRHHLIHSPDPAVRPGAMNRGVLHEAPSVDSYDFSDADLKLRVAPERERIKLGEPLHLSWTLSNKSNEAIPTPDNIGIEAWHSRIVITNPNDIRKWMRSFVINIEGVQIKDLEPGKKLEAETTVFWSSNGFAFEMPGKYTIEILIFWRYAGIPLCVKDRTEVWVDYPVTDEDNEVASLMMHNEVGRYISLGGGAKHLKEAVSRIEAMSKHSKHPVYKSLKKWIKI